MKNILSLLFIVCVTFYSVALPNSVSSPDGKIEINVKLTDRVYYNVVVDGEINNDAAWYYPDPKPAAKKIKNFIAFWKGVEVKE